MTETYREAIDRGNLNTIADAARLGRLGTVLTQNVPRCIRMQVPVNEATYSRIALPSWCKARRIQNAWARVVTAPGTGTLGNMTVAGWGAAPGAGEIGIDGNGDIIMLVGDLYALVDVQYEPVVGEVVTLTDVAVTPGTGICTLPTTINRPFHLISATATQVSGGGLAGVKNVLWPLTAAPAAANVQMELPGLRVRFAVADAVELADITIIVAPNYDLHDMLVQENTNIL